VSIAVLAPGYGGTAEQPLLRRLAARLEERAIVCARVTFTTRGSRPSRGYETELADLRAARDGLLAGAAGPVALIGRSFGGRMCAFLAEQEPPAALVILGHPISPPNRPRPRDEAALAAMACPTLIVQGERDELGPLPVLERIAAQNRHVHLSVLAGVGHDLGKAEAEAIDRAVVWLVGILTAP
jgi:predicted alpha/beta-hydrolase family hydrolase